MSFSTTRLVNHRVIVQGTDIFDVSGKTTLDSTQWDEIKADNSYSQALDAFDAAVEQFFAPLIEASESVAAAQPVAVPVDPMSYVVLSEAVEGVEAQPAQLVHLSADSIVLRLIEEGDTDRLVWVDGRLEVLELVPVLSDDN
jgi:hypothetical protein